MRFLSTLFYMLLSILGLSVISLGGLITVQYFRGKITGTDLHSIMRVIGGTHRIIIPSDVYDRYSAYAADEERAYAELTQNRGLPETRVPAVMRAQEATQQLQENLEVAYRLLANEKRVVEEVRAEVEAQKQQVADLRRALNDERQKNLTVEMDEATRKLRQTIGEMDAGDIATFLNQIILDPSRGGPTEAARIIRNHLSSDFSAEVLGEMGAAERQQVIPLLENRFAGVPPDAVVQIFTDNNLSPGEQLTYLMQMNPQQALGVYLRLPPAVQERIAPQLLRN
ncbi:MAG: hypothetical protein LIP23_05010 [Planctomycetes bacterium]|nr:hypothetical protein [Planctomycetota bacterium]